MRIRNKCQVCNEVTDLYECPQCYSTEIVTVYCCGICGKAYYWRSSEKECCHKVKEERSKQ